MEIWQSLRLLPGTPSFQIPATLQGFPPSLLNRMSNLTGALAGFGAKKFKDLTWSAGCNTGLGRGLRPLWQLEAWGILGGESKIDSAEKRSKQTNGRPTKCNLRHEGVQEHGASPEFVLGQTTSPRDKRTPCVKQDRQSNSASCQFLSNATRDPTSKSTTSMSAMTSCFQRLADTTGIAFALRLGIQGATFEHAEAKATRSQGLEFHTPAVGLLGT